MNLSSFLDAYSLRARFFPALIAGGSAICAFFAFAPWDKMGLPQLGATLLSGILLFGLSDLARRRGKRLESRLYEEWGGKPSTVLLRYSDNCLDAGTKARHLKFLSGKVQGKCPTEADEKKDAKQCDAYYEQCGNWLRENTRDIKKFKILFEENVTFAAGTCLASNGRG